MRDAAYWQLVRQRAVELKSDGCTSALPIYVDCCYEHDIAYRTGETVLKEPQSRGQADRRFAECIQDASILGKASLVSRWRYWAVRLLGWLAYGGKERK